MTKPLVNLSVFEPSWLETQTTTKIQYHIKYPQSSNPQNPIILKILIQTKNTEHPSTEQEDKNHP